MLSERRPRRLGRSEEKTCGRNGFAARANSEKIANLGNHYSPCAFVGVVCWDVRPAVRWEGQVGILLRPVWANRGGAFAQRPVSHATARTTRRSECRKAGSTGLNRFPPNWTLRQATRPNSSSHYQSWEAPRWQPAPLAAPVEIGRIEFALRFAVHSALDVSRG